MLRPNAGCRHLSIHNHIHRHHRLFDICAMLYSLLFDRNRFVRALYQEDSLYPACY